MSNLIDPFFQPRLHEVIELCEILNVEELYFFGSSINGKFKVGTSDLDILVNTSSENITCIAKLNIGLRTIFNCDIDIFHVKWIINEELIEYLKENKVLIYKKYYDLT
jgi:predicted nucleotidyltransferase